MVSTRSTYEPPPVDLLVRMLPSINTQNRLELPNNWVLIRVVPNLHTSSLRILHQPRPTTSLDTRKRRVELLLERVQAAIAIIDSLAERAGRGLAAALAGGREVLPEEGVVEVAAAVEVDHGLQGDLGGDVLLLLCLGDLFAEVVVGCDVGVVVVLVVELHNLAGDGGLEGAIIVYICLLDIVACI